MRKSIYLALVISASQSQDSQLEGTPAKVSKNARALFDERTPSKNKGNKCLPSHTLTPLLVLPGACLKKNADVLFFLLLANGHKSNGKKGSVNKAPNFVKPIASVPHRHSTRASTRSKRQEFEDKAPAATDPALHQKEELAGCSYQFGPLTQ